MGQHTLVNNLDSVSFLVLESRSIRLKGVCMGYVLASILGRDWVKARSTAFERSIVDLGQVSIVHGLEDVDLCD